MVSNSLTNITPFVRGIDAINAMRDASIDQLKKRLFIVEKEIVRCREAGPLMASLCRERSSLRKSIWAIGGTI